MNSPETPNRITALVIHRLDKEAHGEAGITLREAPCAITPAAQRLVETLCLSYGNRLGKGYGKFESDEADFPLPVWLHQYLVERSLGFAELGCRMMEELRKRAAAESLATGGYVLIAHVQDRGSDCLFVAIVSETTGTAIANGLEITDSLHLDLEKLRVAGRIDLTSWQNGAERYISFLKGRAEVAQYFKLFLGCNDVVIALKETQKLVQGLNQFADAHKLEGEARDQMMERAHLCLDELGEAGMPLALDDMVRRVWPDEPERLQRSLDREDMQLATGFVPDRRAIRPLVRFRAASPQWKLEFDRSSLRSGAVMYDRQNDRLILTEIPASLKQALLEE
ncbi:nucleoid-associated protein [Uliginosibacterium sp. H1]|uniref:nucleoid-associated protein n=1 Tax=Uliginosibacterium sp. H1 TaxID=3114757 RepID=UPI002E191AEC|nr:nucleoid-associated protein [Uliginosibacterium sp. H1]